MLHIYCIIDLISNKIEYYDNSEDLILHLDSRLDSLEKAEKDYNLEIYNNKKVYIINGA
jgi:hypothetical protein